MKEPLNLLKELEKKPLRIAIETSSICNANCSFCAYKHSDRPKQIMDFETYKRLLEQVKEFGCEELKFTPITGDALVDPGIIEKIRHAKSLNCFKVIYTFTNLIGLDIERVDDFVNSGLTKVMISTCLQNREDYQRIYGVDHFKRVVKNILALLEANKRNGSPLEIGILLRHDKGCDLKNNPYYQKIKEFNPKISVLNDDYDNWSGMVDLKDLPKGQEFLKPQSKEFPCSQLYNGFVVTPSGDVGMCWARDINLDLKVGNVQNNSLVNIWHSEELKKMRENWLKGKLPNCCHTCLQYCSILDHSLIQKHILNHPFKYFRFLPGIIGKKVKYLIRRYW